MKQENKELLLKYLCMALPYDCIVTIAEGGIDGLQWDNVTLNSYLLYQIEEEDGLEYIKPYLRPMSSMTDEEKKEYVVLSDLVIIDGVLVSSFETFNWLLKNHFDFMGLIPKSLAIGVTEEDNPYNE